MKRELKTIISEITNAHNNIEDTKDILFFRLASQLSLMHATISSEEFYELVAIEEELSLIQNRMDALLRNIQNKLEKEYEEEE